MTRRAGAAATVRAAPRAGLVHACGRRARATAMPYRRASRTVGAHCDVAPPSPIPLRSRRPPSRGDRSRRPSPI
ncbi:hypothetical protein DWU95_35765, partial [Burkholderia contaminans]